MAEDLEAIVRRAIQPLEQQIGQVRTDAREARDGMLTLTSTLKGENISAQVQKLSLDTAAQHTALRQDVVVALGNVRSEIKEIDLRVEVLETDKEQRDGGFTFIGLLKDYAAWFVAIGVGAIALYEKLSIGKP